MVKKVIKKLRGGYDAGGTGGSPVTLAEDIVGLVIYTFQTMEDAIDVINTIGNLSGDMGTAFDEKGAPDPNSIDVKG